MWYQLLSKTKTLYDEIFDVLYRTEQNSVSGGDGNGVSDASDLSKHIEDLKSMLIKDRSVYIVSKLSQNGQYKYILFHFI